MVAQRPRPCAATYTRETPGWNDGLMQGKQRTKKNRDGCRGFLLGGRRALMRATPGAGTA